LEALKDELKRPTTAIAIAIAVITTAVSIAASLLFYYRGIRAGQVSYYVEQVQVVDRTRIIAPSGASIPPLTVLDAYGRPIQDNVYAASVSIWNSGNAEIRKDDVRVPFRIIFDKAPDVIDITPTFFTRDNVDVFALGNGNAITWQHFDPGEGFKVRIIYADTSIRAISVAGYAMGADPNKDYQEYAKTLPHEYSHAIAIASLFLLVLIVLILAARIYIAPKGARRVAASRVFSIFFTFVAILASVVVLIQDLVVISLTGAAKPPF
jgi:hypothetical protein